MMTQDWYCIRCARAGAIEIDNKDPMGSAARLMKAHEAASEGCPGATGQGPRIGALYDENGDIFIPAQGAVRPEATH